MFVFNQEIKNYLNAPNASICTIVDLIVKKKIGIQCIKMNANLLNQFVVTKI